MGLVEHTPIPDTNYKTWMRDTHKKKRIEENKTEKKPNRHTRIYLNCWKKIEDKKKKICNFSAGKKRETEHVFRPFFSLSISTFLFIVA